MSLFSSGITSMNATGGDTIQTIGGYRIHTFTTVGSATFTPNMAGSVEVLVVAGGGGSGGGIGGAGGGGGVLYSASFAVSASPITVTVGGGGAGGADIFTAGTNGGNSVFSSLTAIGGGGGGGDAANLNGKTGGSGGGSASEGSQSPNTGTPGSGTAGQGYAGGSAIEAAPNYGTGGGGGAGQAGANGTSTTGGKGGDGLAFSISGTSTYYGGGGGGGTYAGGTAGQGGLGGGGNGAAGTGAGQNGTNGTGGGGGASGQKTNGYFSNGGSGIVIIRYSTSSGNINSYQTSSKLSYAINTPLFSQLSASATASAVGAYSLRAVNGTTTKAVNVSRGPSGTYPPSALSSTAMTGQTVSGITYTVSHSSTCCSAPQYGWSAFDKVVGNYGSGYWQSAYNYNTSTGVYQGSASLGGYSGEWLKLQLSVSIQLTSYSVEPRSDSWGPLQTPLAWYILGSTDGSTWTVVDSRTGITWTAGVAQTFYPTNKNTYSYFAIVSSYVAPTNTYGSTSISEWILYNTGTDFYADRLGNLLTVPVTGQTLSDWLSGSTGYVATWYDQSGLGNHMSCSSTSIQPKIDPVNKWIDFKTTAYFDTSANPTTGPVPYSNTKNYTVVCRHNTIGDNSGGICGVSNAAPSYNASNFTNNFRRNTTNYQNYWFFNDVNGGTYAAGNSVTFKWDGTNRYIYSNGTLITTQASSNWLQTSSSGQMIGKTTNDTTMNGEMYYLIMFTTALSDADRQLVEALPIS